MSEFTQKLPKLLSATPEQLNSLVDYLSELDVVDTAALASLPTVTLAADPDALSNLIMTRYSENRNDETDKLTLSHMLADATLLTGVDTVVSNGSVHNAIQAAKRQEQEAAALVQAASATQRTALAAAPAEVASLRAAAAAAAADAGSAAVRVANAAEHLRDAHETLTAVSAQLTAVQTVRHQLQALGAAVPALARARAEAGEVAAAAAAGATPETLLELNGELVRHVGAVQAGTWFTMESFSGVLADTFESCTKVAVDCLKSVLRTLMCNVRVARHLGNSLLTGVGAGAGAGAGAVEEAVSLIRAALHQARMIRGSSSCVFRDLADDWVSGRRHQLRLEALPSLNSALHPAHCTDSITELAGFVAVEEAISAPGGLDDVWAGAAGEVVGGLLSAHSLTFAQTLDAASSVAAACSDVVTALGSGVSGGVTVSVVVGTVSPRTLCAAAAFAPEVLRHIEETGGNAVELGLSNAETVFAQVLALRTCPMASLRSPQPSSRHISSPEELLGADVIRYLISDPAVGCELLLRPVSRFMTHLNNLGNFLTTFPSSSMMIHEMELACRHVHTDSTTFCSGLAAVHSTTLDNVVGAVLRHMVSVASSLRTGLVGTGALVPPSTQKFMTQTGLARFDPTAEPASYFHHPRNETTANESDVSKDCAFSPALAVTVHIIVLSCQLWHDVAQLLPSTKSLLIRVQEVARAALSGIRMPCAAGFAGMPRAPLFTSCYGDQYEDVDTGGNQKSFIQASLFVANGSQIVSEDRLRVFMRSIALAAADAGVLERVGFVAAQISLQNLLETLAQRVTTHPESFRAVSEVFDRLVHDSLRHSLFKFDTELHQTEVTPPEPVETVSLPIIASASSSLNSLSGEIVSAAAWLRSAAAFEAGAGAVIAIICSARRFAGNQALSRIGALGNGWVPDFVRMIKNSLWVTTPSPQVIGEVIESLSSSIWSLATTATPKLSLCAIGVLSSAVFELAQSLGGSGPQQPSYVELRQLMQLMQAFAKGEFFDQQLSAWRLPSQYSELEKTAVLAVLTGTVLPSEPYMPARKMQQLLSILTAH